MFCRLHLCSPYSLRGSGRVRVLGRVVTNFGSMERMVTEERDFVWGVAGSAAQTESREGRGPSNWDVFSAAGQRIADSSTTEQLVQFDKRYCEDLDLLAAAGVPAFRLSTAWPRVQPHGPGKPNERGIDHYARLFDAMLERGIEPFVTLFHWDVPTWAGDFRDRDLAFRLADYAEIMVTRLGDRVKHWIMLNEPNTVAYAGYAAGIHAPGLNSTPTMLAAVHHQNLALGLMTRAARASAPGGSRIGTTHNVAATRPASGSSADAEAAKRFDQLWNWAFLDPLFGRDYPEIFAAGVEPFVRPGDLDIINASPDFLGVNYYCRIPIAACESGAGFMFGLNAPTDLERTQYFLVEPDGLTEALVTLRQRYGEIPLYITEAGFALGGDTLEDRAHDPDRSRYLESYLCAAAEARVQGVDLRGFFYWSATDNWEWANGFTKHFGMIAVDPQTQRRLPKESLAKFEGLVDRYFPKLTAAVA